MNYILESEGKAYRKFFEDICAIPHESFKEKALSEYLIRFAKERNLWWYSDEIWNVVIKKPASRSYENHPPVMLQAHTDMVCVKTEDSNFNFDTDSLQLYIEDGWLKAIGTSLGADCGHGLAYMLAVLDDKTLAHPPLECFFSVQEEVGIGGPKFIDYSLFDAKKLINFDMMHEGAVLLSTTAVDGGNILKKLRMEENDLTTFRLAIDGGTGGHGGADIGKDRANAIKLCANVLYQIQKEVRINLVSITGGTARNNLTGFCTAEFACGSSCLEQLKRTGEKMIADFKVEYAGTDPGLYLKMDAIETIDRRLDDLSTKGLIELLMVIPVGVKIRRSLSNALEDMVVSSRHMGKISIEGDTAVISYQLRSCLDSQMREMLEEVMLIADQYGAIYERVIDYPGYYTSINAPLHQLYGEVYKEATGKDLVGVDIHAGTDVGTILRNIKGMEMTTVGPDTVHVHTPNEALNIESFDRTYKYLKTILSRL